jgi:hypothetical protein
VKVFCCLLQSGAIHVVRTIGRVFDICHRINQQSTDSDKAAEAGNVKEPGAAEGESRSFNCSNSGC